VRGAGRAAPVADPDIPGAVAYVRDRIPDEIQQKADEIAQLRRRFEAMEDPPDVPNEYEDPIMREIMTIPVFPASHPQMRNGLNALRAALRAGGAEATEALNANRALRHTMEKDSLEQIMRASPLCPACRHQINRNSLRIDTQLQDEILEYLRRTVIEE
jgi:hypothetical protein